MSAGTVAAGIASLALVASSVAAVIVIFAIERKKNGGAPALTTESRGAKNASIGWETKVVAGRDSLDVKQMAKPPNGSVAADGSLRVTYPAGGFASKGGLVAGVEIDPCTSVTLSYEVLFESPWCWGGSKVGGKLPGLWLGAPGAGCGTGGNWGPNCGSLRVMWSAEGAPYCYIYYPTSKSQPDMSEQSAAYRAKAKDSGKTGHSMFKRELGKLVSDGKTWNKVSLSAKLNSVGKLDGSFSVSINGISRSFEGMRWRAAADQLIRTVEVHSFRGGSSKEWSCPDATHARFRNFTVKTTV